MGRVTSAGPAPSRQSMWSPTSSGAGLLATGRAVEPRVGSRRSLEILTFPWNSHHTRRAGNEIQLRRPAFGSFQFQSYREARMSQSHGSVRLSRAFSLMFLSMMGSLKPREEGGLSQVTRQFRARVQARTQDFYFRWRLLSSH